MLAGAEDAAPSGGGRGEQGFEFEFAPEGSRPAGLSMVRAEHWEAQAGGRIVCRLCPRECRVADAERGSCGVRTNDGGIYKTLVHSRVCAVHRDPIEKKPFFHVLPGVEAFSIATAGCNIQCRFCQNWEISQFRPEQVPSVEATPAQVVAAADRAGCPLIAFTYSEPVVFWEYARDVADAARGAGIRCVMVSNGYIQEKPLREIAPRLQAIKIDLKGFTEDFYRDTCDARLAPVLRSLEVLKETGTWFEIVNLVVPTLNDGDDAMKRLCAWVVERLGPETPIHFTRFQPAYRLTNLPPTPAATLERCHRHAREAGLVFAYVGNLPGHPAESTVCPGCGDVLIRRSSYTILENRLDAGRCPRCARAIPGVWT
jgi:pyruvate formate lyase activating enzyme